MKWRFSYLLTVLLIGTFLSGCYSSRYSEPLKGKDVPLSGGKMEEEIWQAINEDPEASSPSANASRSLTWLVPFVLSSREISLIRESFSQEGEVVEVPPEVANTAHGSKVLWKDVLGPLFLTTLPWHIYIRENRYERGEAEPVASRGLGYTPFWLWDWNRGDFGDETVFKAFGVPLLFSCINIDAQSGDLETKLGLTQILWTLGPSYIDFDLTDFQGNEARGYYANPLFLGGALGSVLWVDYKMDSHSAKEGRGVVYGHGPLFGALGYLESKGNYIEVETEEETVSMPKSQLRLLLGGLLWMDKKTRNDEGAVEGATHGPLWGMFAFGKKDKRPAVKLFWIPIKF